MPAVARIGDPVSCSVSMVAGSPNVFANGIPISRCGDATTHHPGSCGPTILIEGSSTVFVNYIATGRVGDHTPFHCSHIGAVSAGSPNVFAGGGTQSC